MEKMFFFYPKKKIGIVRGSELLWSHCSRTSQPLVGIRITGLLQICMGVHRNAVSWSDLNVVHSCCSDLDVGRRLPLGYARGSPSAAVRCRSWVQNADLLVVAGIETFGCRSMPT